jgi:hypothetical protein
VSESPGDILLALGRLEGKVDSLISQERRTRADITDIEHRLRQLEHSKALLFGACTVLASLTSYAVTLITP